MEVIKRGARDNVASFASTDNAMVNQVWDTHTGESHYVDVKPILLIVEDIFNRSAPTIHRIIHVFLSSFSPIFFSCVLKMVAFDLAVIYPCFLWYVLL